MLAHRPYSASNPEQRRHQRSSATGHSINQVIESLAHFLNIEPKLNYLPQKQPAIEKNVLCNKRACELFDWSPDRDINTIITLLIKSLVKG